MPLTTRLLVPLSRHLNKVGSLLELWESLPLRPENQGERHSGCGSMWAQRKPDLGLSPQSERLTATRTRRRPAERQPEGTTVGRWSKSVIQSPWAAQRLDFILLVALYGSWGWVFVAVVSMMTPYQRHSWPKCTAHTQTERSEGAESPDASRQRPEAQAQKMTGSHNSDRINSKIKLPAQQHQHRCTRSRSKSKSESESKWKHQHESSRNQNATKMLSETRVRFVFGLVGCCCCCCCCAFGSVSGFNAF